ncbi:MAG: flagellar basal body P-ring formation protein FlgA [Candidatus Margulisbacteria bacterium]|nr:flagellar basal body P-ring formation protein FlgA [Candidatus Margulisiibacteriota bacterium]
MCVQGEDKKSAEIILTEHLVSRVMQHYPYLVTNDVRIRIKNKEAVHTRLNGVTSFAWVVKNQRRVLGDIVIPIEVVRKSGQKDIVSVVVLIEAFSQFARAKKNILQGQAIDTNHWEMIYTSLSGKSNPVNDLTILKGKEARTLIPKGSFLMTDYFRDIPLVKQGNVVNIELPKSQVLLSFKGIALEDGEKGDIIQVRHVSYSKVLKGEIVGTNNIKISSR